MTDFINIVCFDNTLPFSIDIPHHVIYLNPRYINEDFEHNCTADYYQLTALPRFAHIDELMQKIGVRPYSQLKQAVEAPVVASEPIVETSDTITPDETEKPVEAHVEPSEPIKQPAKGRNTKRGA